MSKLDELICNLIGKVEISAIAIEQAEEIINEIKKYEKIDRENGVSYEQKKIK